MLMLIVVVLSAIRIKNVSVIRIGISKGRVKLNLNKFCYWQCYSVGANRITILVGIRITDVK